MKHKATSRVSAQVGILAAVIFVIILLAMTLFSAGIFLTYAAMVMGYPVMGYPVTDFIGTAVGISQALLAVMLVSCVIYILCAYLKTFKD